jgi:hypothetical protein
VKGAPAFAASIVLVSNQVMSIFVFYHRIDFTTHGALETLGTAL